MLFADGAEVFADHLREATLRTLAELIVARGFFVDHNAPAAVTRIEPLAGRRHLGSGAVDAHSRPHLYERATLGQFGGFLVFDTDQGRTLIFLDYANCADEDSVTTLCLANFAPVTGGANQTDQEHRPQNDCRNNEKVFLQLDSYLRIAAPYFQASRGFCQTLTTCPELACYGDGNTSVGLWMETLLWTKVESPVGPLFLAASSRGLVALEFDQRLAGQQTIRPNPRDLRAESRTLRLQESEESLRPYLGQLTEYFAGERRHFDFPVDLRGTDFQLACWHALLEIPYGETRSYAEIARRVGRPLGFRAVGMANNRNPVAIVVPCHRVIASDGSLCGYGGGLEVKRHLLGLEGARLAEKAIIRS